MGGQLPILADLCLGVRLFVFNQSASYMTTPLSKQIVKSTDVIDPSFTARFGICGIFTLFYKMAHNAHGWDT